MKIAVFHPRFGGGGLDRVVVRLTKGFVQAGHQVDLLAAEVSGTVYDDVDPGVNEVPLKAPIKLPAIKRLVSVESWTSLLSIPPLYSYLREQRPDILFAASSLNAAVVGKALARTDTKTVLRVSLHQSGSTQHDEHLTARLLPYVRRLLFKGADMVVTNSAAGAEDLQKSLSLDARKVMMINNPSADPEIAIKAQAEVDHPWLDQHEVPVAVAVGRLAAVKDVSTLIRAFAIVVSKTPCRLLVIGQGVEEQKLKDLASELNISDSIDFIGFVDNPWAYMKRADIFVMSSRVEGSPNSLIEAMFLGVPAIATDCPTGPKEILQDGKLGHLIEMGDHESFARAWLEILADPEKAKATAESAMEHISRFEFDTVVNEFLAMFSKQLEGPATN